MSENETAKRLNQGREAQQLLKNPLMEGFFKSHFAVCQKAFCDLPMGCSIEQYQTVQHDFLAIQRLHSYLETYIMRAKTDVLDQKAKNRLPENMDV